MTKLLGAPIVNKYWFPAKLSRLTHILKRQPGRKSVTRCISKLTEFSTPCRGAAEGNDTRFRVLQVDLVAEVMAEKAPVKLGEIFEERLSFRGEHRE